ncbi:uncharacterized protein Z518_06286 [Rhinocladiella mackenziei CBS 650.93]|uniref:Integral membrane protein n=1 Tax=Rhinocladiella mackenziei CBS 650.93 TaxID=1442369 RepID=A0A0D2II31_9EURO|nr:uncharacterized protein Z518_06286 [Rhinocladiella mackenziei CBS 650.93]KIX05414.1 hypothetical protein Z518_06286 [Rhinocladiella mackenziei CBS 650.93]
MDATRRVDITAFRPLLRAYTLGYLTTTGPRLFGFLRSRRRQDVTVQEKLNLLYTILKTSTQLNRFPTAAAVAVGGSTALPRLVRTILQWIFATLGRPIRLRSLLVAHIHFICSLLSAWLAFDLLNRDEDWVRKRAKSRSAASVNISDFKSPNPDHLSLPSYHPHYAGKTIDFTLFAFCRALDVAIITTWTRTRSMSKHPGRRSPRLANFIGKMADPSIFATSAAIIMWSWFYSPHRLPRAYNHWISKAADVDFRLIQALRLARQGDFVYGEDTGQAPLLAGLCRDFGLPEEYADPSKTIPIPCELYHCGTGKSCEFHAVSRFWRSWKFAMEIYVPLQLLARIRSPNLKSILHSLISAARSSSFLATFVGVFYYAVCLARTRLGPKLFSYKTVTPQMWDSGLCVLAGCLACGWSILLEKPSRRREIAFFVAPRALATILPRVYDKQYIRREQTVFATSVALVLTTLQAGSPRNVRGVFGRILEGVVRD